MLKILVIVAGGYFLLVVFVYLTQAGMIYLPDLPGRQLEATPAAIGMAYEDVTLRTSDGVLIHGWFVQGASHQVVLFFHGNAGNISHRLHTLQQFSSLDVSVFIVDYRGYGQSDGKPTEKGLYRDAEAAWDFLTRDRGIDAGNIVIYGRSLGGSVASWLAAKNSPAGLIIDSSFTSAPDIGQELYPWLPVRWLSRFDHATRQYAADANSPVLVVHSRDDEIIPFHHGERIFEASPEPKSLLELRGGHNDTHVTSSATYVAGMRQFLGRL